MQAAEHGEGIPAARAAGRMLPGLVLDLDATLITCHSEKQQAAPTYKGGVGYHPLLCFLVDTGEALSGRLRPGNAGANTASGHITVLDHALAQIPDAHRHGTDILVRTDRAGSAKVLLAHVRDLRKRGIRTYALLPLVMGLSATGRGAGTAPLAIVVAGIGICGVGWVIAQYAKRIHLCSSLYEYVSDSAGPRVGVIAGWLYYGAMMVLGASTFLVLGGLTQTWPLNSLSVEVPLAAVAGVRRARRRAPRCRRPGVHPRTARPRPGAPSSSSSSSPW